MAVLEHFARNESYFLGKLVTGDETWIYCFDPETKEQFRNGGSGSPRPKKFQVQKLVQKQMRRIFWDKKGVLLVDYFQQGSTINSKI